jgi:hypothetical protein
LKKNTSGLSEKLSACFTKTSWSKLESFINTAQYGPNDKLYILPYFSFSLDCNSGKGKMKFDDYILELLSGWNLSFILVSLVLTFFWFRSRRPVDIPPGPTPFPFIGNLTSLFGSDLLQTNRKLKEKYGNIYSLSLGPIIYVKFHTK